jgi:polar amino acid transport system permease protein
MGGQTGRDSDFPWWLVLTLAIGGLLVWQIAASDLYSEILDVIRRGIAITILVTLVAFTLATLLGLLVAMAALSRWLLLRQLARLYVEVLRGVPILVLLLYIAFVATPGLVWLYNTALAPLREAGLVAELQTRDVSMLARAVMALTIGYSAFIAEVFRAGILAVDRGQIEAAEALGLSPGDRFRFVVLPQAIRIVLPPLGNDFVAMVKDSSLVSVLGVADVTQMAKLYAAGSFRFLETYNILAGTYLTMTIGLSLALRALERRLRGGGR